MQTRALYEALEQNVLMELCKKVLLSGEIIVESRRVTEVNAVVCLPPCLPKVTCLPLIYLVGLLFVHDLSHTHTTHPTAFTTTIHH